MTPLSHFNVMTPLGLATCIGIRDEYDDVEWITFIKATGEPEPWIWKNPHIRLEKCITEGHNNPSPISIPKGLENHIKRYKKNGWL